MSRPEVRNAFDERMIAEIHQAVDDYSKEDDVRAIVITGEGSAFSAGADISWMKRMGQAGFDENYEDALKLARMMRAIYTCGKPTIARVNGPTTGGGTAIVASCYIAVPAEPEFYRVGGVKRGLLPACGARGSPERIPFSGQWQPVRTAQKRQSWGFKVESATLP